MAGFSNDTMYATNVNLSGAKTPTITLDGQLIIGHTALNAGGTHIDIGNLTSPGGTVTIGYSNPNITLDVVGGGLPWTDVTGATQTLAVNNGYVTNRSAGVTYTLPATATEGNIIRVAGKDGAWTIAQNANQQINLGSASTTVGVAGSLGSTDPGDCVEMLCTTSGASTVWRVLSSMGNITVT